MDSQTSADAFIDEFGRSCSCSNLSDTTFGVSNGCCAKEIVDKLMVQLKEKNEQLEGNKIKLDEKIKELEASKEDNKKLLTGYDCEKARANQANTAMVEMSNKLTVAETKQKEYQEMNAALQMTLWKSFPSAHLCYYIKIPALGYLYANHSCQDFLRTADDPQQPPLPCVGYFKFTKHSDGSFSIYSVSKGKYLRKHPTSSLSTFVHFAADECGTFDTKFVLFFHQQDQHSGIMVDIRSLAHDCYLAKEKTCNCTIDATERKAPDNKFLIIPVLDGQ